MDWIRKVSDFWEKLYLRVPKFEGKNAAFQEAIFLYSKKRSSKNLEKLSSELTKAFFLVPHADPGQISKKGKPKKKSLAKKKKAVKKPNPEPIVLLYISDERGRVFLPAFSHPSESLRYFGKETRLLPVAAKELWWLGLQNKEVSGIAIDPGSTLWILSREHLEILQKEK